MDTSSDSTSGAKNFIGHVLKFDEDTKQELMNVAQYTALAIIPITIYNHLVKSVIPELDETKGNIELLIEVLGEMLFVLIGLFLIHRLVTFMNTYSGKSYGTFNIFNIILLYLVICQDQSSNIGSKIKVLTNRAKELWTGKPENNKETEKDKNKNPIVMVAKQQAPQTMPTHQTSRADYVNTHSQMMPQMPSQQTHTGGSGSSNNMYQQPDAQPFNEPMAANEGFGGFTSF